jgi:hypothetical protein
MMTRATFLRLFTAGLFTERRAGALELTLPLKPKSVRFALIGDNGTGERPQYEVGETMVQAREKFPFEFVLMLGDNIYGSKSASAFYKKFEDPYKPLLDAGVKFYASLGNHDHTDEIFYKPFNMNGKRYYSFRNGNAFFLALDSSYMDPRQLDWIGSELSASDAAWKICFFHHPLYTHARFHGEDIDLRALVEPVLLKYGVNPVFNGHQHVYERLKPQKGITYFVLGNSGQLRAHDLAPSPETAKGLDTDQAFMLAEIAGDELFFQTISRTGATVDSGTIQRTGVRKETNPNAQEEETLLA